MPSRSRRRAVSWPGLALIWTLLVVAALPALVLALLVDLAGRRWRLRLTRVYLLGLGVATVELVCFLLGGAVWLLTAGGRLVSPRRWTNVHFWIQNRWIKAHLGVARITCRLRLDMENPEVVAGGDVIVAARHISHADALFPAHVLANVAGLEIRYSLKEELQWLPAMDLVGNRLPHVWVDRSPDPGSPLFGRLRATAAHIEPGVAGAIFPESTFFTPERLGRALERLRATRPDLAEQAATLRHVLPPRPAGTQAMLEGAANADVVVMGNVGLEAFSSISDIIASVPLRHDVRIRMWRHPRSTVPTAASDQATWLLHRWVELDHWIDGQLGRIATGEPAAPPDRGRDREQA